MHFPIRFTAHHQSPLGSQSIKYVHIDHFHLKFCLSSLLPFIGACKWEIIVSNRKTGMFSQGVISLAKWSVKTRAGADVKGSTKFKLKKKGAKSEGKVDMAKARAAKLALLERYGKVLAYPRPKKPVRTEEELVEARTQSLIRNKKLQEREFIMRRREQTYIRLRQLAFEELPTELHKQFAEKPDLTPYPRDFITVLAQVPLEEEEIFGTFMTYGSRMADDDPSLL